MTANVILLFCIMVLIVSLPKTVHSICSSSKQTALHIKVRKVFFPVYYRFVLRAIKSNPALFSYPLLVELELNKEEYRKYFITNGYYAVVDRITEFADKFIEEISNLSKVSSSVLAYRKPKNNTIQESINFMRKFREAENLGLTVEQLYFMEKEGTSFNDN